MKIPYGMSNFGELRRTGRFYADKTRFIPDLESEGYSTKVGFTQPRADLVIPSLRLIIEAKFARATDSLKEIQRRSEGDFQRISDILATIVPNTKRVQVKKHGKNLSLEFTQEWGDKKRLKFEGFSMSDGTLRAIGLLAAVFQRPVPSLIAIEEPEATIHPGALESVLDLLRHASRHMQVVITTHSPELLDAKWIDDRHLRIVEWTEGATRVAPVSDATRKALHGHLMGAGELLRSNALEPAPLFEEPTSFLQGNLFEDFA
jgi:hypothetical protein